MTTHEKLRVAHFSFANSKYDAEAKASPVERLDAIYSFFAWARATQIMVVGATEAHRASNGMDWPRVLDHIERTYGYRCGGEALSGDRSERAFSDVLFIDVAIAKDYVFGVKALTPPELEETQWAVRCPTMHHYRDTDLNLVYCHLSLSRDGRGDTYTHLLHELRKLATLVSEGWVAFGDFNLTHECRARLFGEERALMASLNFQFGGADRDVSFTTFPHDRIPLSAFKHCPDNVLHVFDDGLTANGLSALDAICGGGDGDDGHTVTSISRHLPYRDFREMPCTWRVDEVVKFISQEGMPPVCDWVSDHWILCFDITHCGGEV